MKCLVCTMISLMHSARSQVALFWFMWWWWWWGGTPKQPLFISLLWYSSSQSAVPPVPSRLLHHSGCLIKERWSICVSTDLAHLPLLPDLTSGRTPSLPMQLVPSSLAINPAGQIHRKLPSVFSQRPWEQRCWTWAHSSMSVNKKTMGEIRAVELCSEDSVCLFCKTPNSYSLAIRETFISKKNSKVNTVM